jgi:predicted O-linked N-acetylglucosamine transferase (SPINDLY family)
MATISEALTIAVEHHQAGRLSAAEQIYRRILAVAPNQPDALHLLGVLDHQLGRHDAAIEQIRRAIAANGMEPAYHGNLGSVLSSVGRLDEAAAAFRRALELKPDQADACYNLGNALRDQGKSDEAIAAYRRALELRPGYAEAHNNLGNVLEILGRLDEAIACFRRALELNPAYAEASHNLGNALHAQWKVDDAVVSYGEALKLKPDFVAAHNGLGNAFKTQGKLDDAVACYRRAIELNPAYAVAYSGLGNVLKLQEKVTEAIASYRQALALDPNYHEAHSNLLLTLQYRPDISLAELAAAHAEFDRQHAEPLRNSWRPHENDRKLDRRLRVGFVSPDFGRHPVGYFLVRGLENLDGSQWETVAYNDRTNGDDLTARLRAATTEWCDVRGLTDEELARKIRDDRIDILFDLAGHTAKNRLLVFARKPAPIQVTWAGYVGTTGLKAMDYLLADRHQVPSGAEVHYSEKIFRMPDGYVTYDPPHYAPPVSPLPALQRGHVTFGCFNNPAKLNGRVFEVWAQILHRVPGARLVLKFTGMNDRSMAKIRADEFARQGIDPQRIDFLGSSPHQELLAEYRRIDLALDPFPYSGGLTTCEALWMGVPVVTSPGETFASRHTLGHLSNVGLTETIASTPDEYVERAVSLANDLPRLAALRTELRERMAASPLCDGKRFATNLTILLRDAWKQWIAQGQ